MFFTIAFWTLVFFLVLLFIPATLSALVGIVLVLGLLAAFVTWLIVYPAVFLASCGKVGFSWMFRKITSNKAMWLCILLFVILIAYPLCCLSALIKWDADEIRKAKHDIGLIYNLWLVS